MLQSVFSEPEWRSSSWKNNPSGHIAVVHGDARLRMQMARLLRGAGCTVTGLADGRALLARKTIQRPDLVLVEMERGCDDALALCARIRESDPVPIIVLSAHASEPACVAALDAGADDYVSWPGGTAGLLARVRSLLRRGAMTRPEGADGPASCLRFAGWEYQVAIQQLRDPSGRNVALTAAEHELLVTLLNSPQRAIGRERLLELCRYRMADSGNRSIDVLVSRLRSKMGVRKAKILIKAVRGVGYMLAAEVEAVHSVQPFAPPASRPDARGAPQKF